MDCNEYIYFMDIKDDLFLFHVGLVRTDKF
jgi:hypothetical protein